MLQLQLSMWLQEVVNVAAAAVVNAVAVALIYVAAVEANKVAAVALMTDRLSTRVGFMKENINIFFQS